MAILRVEMVDPFQDRTWDRFVESHPSASAYHLAAWARILGRSYRFEPRYLRLCETDGATRGVLPLMAKQGILSRNRLRSLPVVPAGGPLAETEGGATMLLDHACGLAEESGAELVVQARSGGLARTSAGLAVSEGPPSWILDLPLDDPDAWLRHRSTNLTRSLKKARAAGLTVRQAESERDLQRFYRLYLGTMRRHRALPRLYRQLRLARELLAPVGVFRLFLVEHQGTVVAGGVFHALGTTVELLYNASDPHSLKLRPNHALYHHVTEWAAERRLTRMDFGFAHHGSTLAAFKAQWGAAPVPEYVYRAPSATAGSPPGAELGERFGLVARAWQRAPLTLTRAASLVAYRYL